MTIDVADFPLGQLPSPGEAVFTGGSAVPGALGSPAGDTSAGVGSPGAGGAVDDIPDAGDAGGVPVLEGGVNSYSVGDKIDTRWGIATLRRSTPDGGFWCSWPGLEEQEHMTFHFGDEQVLAEKSGGRSGDVSVVSSIGGGDADVEEPVVGGDSAGDCAGGGAKESVVGDVSAGDCAGVSLDDHDVSSVDGAVLAESDEEVFRVESVKGHRMGRLATGDGAVCKFVVDALVKDRRYILSLALYITLIALYITLSIIFLEYNAQSVIYNALNITLQKYNAEALYITP